MKKCLNISLLLLVLILAASMGCQNSGGFLPVDSSGAQRPQSENVMQNENVIQVEPIEPQEEVTLNTSSFSPPMTTEFPVSSVS